jgi:hypothetical protein
LLSRLETCEGGAFIAYIFGRSYVTCKGRCRRIAQWKKVTPSLLFLFFCRINKLVFFMEGREGVEGKTLFLAMCNGVGFKLNNLVDVFVGTGKGVRGNKSFPIKGRFQGVRVEKGEERFMCRPIVGSQKGRCPSFPPESCMKVKAFGSDVYGERRPLHFSKLKSEVQERSTLAPPAYCYPSPHNLFASAHPHATH